MPSKGKEKGNRNETALANWLTKWWGKPFKRLPNSGALRWQGATFTYADLLPPEDFPAVIETKHYHRIDIDRELSNHPNYNLVQMWWFDEICRDALRCQQETGNFVQPLLIYKEDYGHFRLCMDTRLWDCFPLEVRKAQTWFEIHYQDEPSFIICETWRFLELVSKEVFQRACEICLDNSQDRFWEAFDVSMEKHRGNQEQKSERQASDSEVSNSEGVPS